MEFWCLGVPIATRWPSRDLRGASAACHRRTQYRRRRIRRSCGRRASQGHLDLTHPDGVLSGCYKGATRGLSASPVPRGGQRSPNQILSLVKSRLPNLTLAAVKFTLTQARRENGRPISRMTLRGRIRVGVVYGWESYTGGSRIRVGVVYGWESYTGGSRIRVGVVYGWESYTGGVVYGWGRIQVGRDQSEVDAAVSDGPSDRPVLERGGGDAPLELAPPRSSLRKAERSTSAAPMRLVAS